MHVSERELIREVIAPALASLDEHNPVAPQLLCAMAKRASGLDPLYRGNGGIGLYQITSEQHRRVWDDYVAPNPELASRLRGLASQRQFLRDPDCELQFNMIYATAIAWLHRCMRVASERGRLKAPAERKLPALVSR